MRGKLDAGLITRFCHYRDRAPIHGAVVASFSMGNSMDSNLPNWCLEDENRHLLISQLSTMADEVDVLRQIANRNYEQGENRGFCESETSYCVPSTVRKLSESDEELKSAIAACRPQTFLKNAFGNNRSSDPLRDREHIQELARSSEVLLRVVNARLSLVELKIRRERELLDLVLSKLSRGEANVLRCLLKNRHGVSFETLSELPHTWQKGNGSDQAILRRLDRMKDHLSDAGWMIEYPNRRAKLIDLKKLETDRIVG